MLLCFVTSAVKVYHYSRQRCLTVSVRPPAAIRPNNYKQTLEATGVRA